MSLQRSLWQNPASGDSTSSAEDRLASLAVMPASDEARQITATSGQRCAVWLPKQSLVQSWLRTLLGSSRWMSPIGQPIWRVRDTTSGLWYFQLRLLGLRTSGSASSFWPTPKTNAGRASRKSLTQGHWSKPDLEQMIELAEGQLPHEFESEAALTPQARRLYEAAHLWPTPLGHVSNDGESVETWLERRERERQKGQNGNGMGLSLTIAAQFWPTPTMAMHKDGTPRTNRTGTQGLRLDEQLARMSGKRVAKLNPSWVEALMGFPPGWTEIDPITDGRP